MRYQIFTSDNVDKLSLAELNAICDSKINSEYILESIQNEQLLVVIVSRNEKHEAIGFCIVSVHETETDDKKILSYGFIDLLCSAKESRKSKSSGGDLLRRAEYELKSRGYTVVSLHSLYAVNDFYFRRGYMFTTPEYAEAQEQTLVFVGEDEVIMSKFLDANLNLSHEFMHKRVAPPDGDDTRPKKGKITEVWYSASDGSSTTSITYENGEKEDIATGIFGAESDMPRLLAPDCNIVQLHQRVDHIEAYLNGLGQ
jgi:hypothetical protein